MHKFFENPTNFSLQDIQDSDISGAEQDIKISRIIKDIKEKDHQQEYNENLGQFVYADLDDSNYQLAIDFVFENRSFNVSTSYKAMDIAKYICIQNINNPQINQIIYNIAENIKKLADSEKHVKSFTATVLVDLNNNNVVNLKESENKDEVGDSNKETKDISRLIPTITSTINRVLFAEEIETEELSQAIAISLESCANEIEEKSNHFDETGEGSSSGTNNNMKEDVIEEKTAKESNSLKRKREKEDTEENNKELAKKQKTENIDKTLINAFEEKINTQDFQESELLLKTLKEIIFSKDQTILTNLYMKMQDILASENIMLPKKICKQFVEEYLVGWYVSGYLIKQNHQFTNSENNANEFKMDCVGDGGLLEGMNQ